MIKPKLFFLTAAMFACLFVLNGITIAQTDMGGPTVCAVVENGKRRVVPCPTSNPSPPTGSNPPPDNSAKEKAERDRQTREAEEKRLADEAKKKKEAEERQKAFEKSRDEALQTLKGSGGGTTIRDVGGNVDREIKGSSPQSGIRDGRQTAAVKTEPAVPKFFETTVSQAFPTASPEVAERIRKGFQAVMNRDWNVARAWFLDAQNRDPKNIGIKRLVALTDYKIEAKEPAATVPAQTPVAEQEKIFQEIMEKGLNEFYLEYVPRHPELKMRVIIKPKKAEESTIETFLKDLKKMLSRPQPKLRVTAVVAVRG